MSSSTVKVAKGELVFTSFLLVISLIVLYDTFTLDEQGLNVIVGPRAFALVIGFLLFGLTSLQLISVLRGNKGQPDAIEGGELVTRPNWKSLFIVIGGIVFHILAIELVGFILATIPLFFAVSLALGERRWFRTLIIAAIVAGGTFLTFTQGLQLDLPVGFEFLEQETPIVLDDNGEIVIEEDQESW
ncbi:tripartite tricarboxylate transporter TctB family protein [Candidatus Aquiluna sp. UB-MaderosW2red]|uniref:tripartite tricarboxylate transporter TctB family protein n=1 Tax=Candidatus Aquiluna sp. UB-MaderosW2red TaxID=1855377 RepID=UPI000875D38F|nr:tripartite tricarboxylate transporter TctB family protein [Candidatus Aquiluna sp. UB-MaderosW2red]SCX05407.1 putative tricarboxylic transport membrane protein [Candidatus Aquiluna sp. UB-MaderosW2red]